MTRSSAASPFVEFDREQWRHLRKSMPQVLTETELDRLRGVGENIDLHEVSEVYLPLSRLISYHVEARRRLSTATALFLGEEMPPVPFIIGVAGSVAVGKSTTARLLQVLLERWPSHPRVDLVTTDGFLHPSEELNRRGIMHRKGFPESYDQHALMQFVAAVKSGVREVPAPVYSHTLYDRVPGTYEIVDQPDILILEGLNVLQTGPTLMISDLFDFSVYVNAKTEDIERWYIERFLKLRYSAFRQPGAHFKHFAELDDEAARIEAREIWQSINLPNLVENIKPTAIRASLVLHKGPNHAVERVRMRKV